jgi:hypothetical protein
MTDQAAEWDARASRDLGILIASYLLQHPAPEDSQTANALAKAAHDLQAAGQFGLAELRVRPLVCIEGGAA